MRGYELADRPDGVADLRGGPVRGSLLEAWAEVLVRQGTTAAIGDETWARVMDSLDGPRSDLVVSLLSSVQGLDRADHLPVALEEFLSGIDRPASAARGQEFSAEHFTAAARAAERLRVDVHADTHSHLGLSRVVALVQLSEARPAWDFAVTAVRADEPGGGAVPIPELRHDGPHPVRDRGAPPEPERVPRAPGSGVF